VSNEMYKVGAIILNDKTELLVVRKYYKDRVEYITPGGRQEPGETDEQTLARELKEELGVQVVSFSYFDTYHEMAVLENVPLKMSVYRVKILGVPTPHSEIKDVVWVDRNFAKKGYKIGSIMAEHIIPRLVAEGLM
jgi:8-oxo-dGTP diphosphatase